MDPTHVESAHTHHSDRYLKFFTNHIQSINELDYGDFMRQSNMDILGLREALKNEGQAVHKIIDEMQLYTQFAPSWQIEPTRARLLADINLLRRTISH